MMILCEARWIREGTENDDEPAYEKGKYWLLHWGLKYDMTTDREGNSVAFNYTVAICQECETGQVETFLPEQLKIIGTKIK